MPELIIRRLYLPSQINLLKPGRKYIVKPIWEDGSLGITEESVFECKPGFEEKLKGLDDSHWFIEDFIDGREFNISVLAGKDGPEVLPPAEIVFVNYDDNRPRIVDFKANGKWIVLNILILSGNFRETNLIPNWQKNLKEAALPAGNCLD